MTASSISCFFPLFFYWSREIFGLHFVRKLPFVTCGGVPENLVLLIHFSASAGPVCTSSYLLSTCGKWSNFSVMTISSTLLMTSTMISMTRTLLKDLNQLPTPIATLYALTLTMILNRLALNPGNSPAFLCFIFFLDALPFFFFYSCSWETTSVELRCSSSSFNLVNRKIKEKVNYYYTLSFRGDLESSARIHSWCLLNELNKTCAFSWVVLGYAE